MVRQLESKNGDRAFLDLDDRGFILIVNFAPQKGAHAEPRRTLVHRVSTEDMALDAARILTGMVWRVI